MCICKNPVCLLGFRFDNFFTSHTKSSMLAARHFAPAPNPWCGPALKTWTYFTIHYLSEGILVSVFRPIAKITRYDTSLLVILHHRNPPKTSQTKLPLRSHLHQPHLMRAHHDLNIHHSLTFISHQDSVIDFINPSYIIESVKYINSDRTAFSVVYFSYPRTNYFQTIFKIFWYFLACLIFNGHNSFKILSYQEKSGKIRVERAGKFKKPKSTFFHGFYNVSCFKVSNIGYCSGKWTCQSWW